MRKIIPLFLLICCIMATFYSVSASPAGDQPVPKIGANTASPLSAKEGARFDKIIDSAENYGFQLTPEIRQEFWAFLDKMGATDPDVQKLHDRYSFANLYERSFMQDALASYRAGYPIKSRERKIWENMMKNDADALTNSFNASDLIYVNKLFSTNDTAIMKTAAHKPAVVFGYSVKLDEAQCKKSIDVFSSVQVTLDELFTRPGVGQARQADYRAADAQLCFDTATDYQSKGQHDKAISELRRAIEAKSDFAPAHGQLVNELAAIGDYEGAIAEARLLLKGDPNNPVVHLNLGNALFKSGKKEEAREEWQKVLATGDPLASILAKNELKDHP